MEISDQAFAALLAEIADLKRRLENAEHVVIDLHDKSEVNDGRIAALADQTEQLRRAGHQRHATVLNLINEIGDKVDAVQLHVMPDVVEFNLALDGIVGTPDHTAPERLHTIVSPKGSN